jgi:hypothetical protein
VVTLVTVAAGPDWASATAAIGTVAVAVVAVGVALFAERRAGLRLREEHERSNQLIAEERASHAREIEQERAHAAAQLQEDRLWNRRVELYARINRALHRYIEQPPTGPDGRPLAAPEVPGLAHLVSEADMLASKPLADLLNQFVYDNPDNDRQLDIWNKFQWSARAELSVDRTQQSSTRVPGIAHRDLRKDNSSAVQPSDP